MSAAQQQSFPHLSIEQLEATAATLELLRNLDDDKARHASYTQVLTEVHSVIRNSKDISIGNR